ncbi:hypothetical protein [Silvanigrella aquatica]|uniref:Uncharacterized protein n=1 Tax=Silvanigrella aquatica TaxID=1915309 RepID=A0A1L4D507_9BACT|nr:hypothetical protein [Silvanigrella aquatica]APJ05284.1 hypothetical protein AXG55_14780 [Silvanigrella aquatica]
MKLNIINKLKYFYFLSGFLVFNQNSFAYSEAQIGAYGVFFPQQNLDNDTFNPFGGWSVKADIMNNSGFSFGLGHTWSPGYRWVDIRETYWFQEHMYGIYLGLEQHIQYFNNTGFGIGLNLGYMIPLTYYINFNIDGEAGYGSNKFYRSIYDPFYFNVSAGFSINIM